MGFQHRTSWYRLCTKYTTLLKTLLWKLLGGLSLVMAYIGVITPGIPFSIFVVLSAFCFGKSSPSMYKWLYNHKSFGPFLTNWVNNRVFPTKMKYMMILVMSSSIGILWFTTHNFKAIICSVISMCLVAGWAWRYPGSLTEYHTRKENQKQIGCFK